MQSSEKKTLESILNAIETEKTYFYNKVWFNPFLWFLSVFIFFLLFRYHSNGGSIAVIVIASACLGLVGGIFAILRLSHKSWAHIKKYINVQEVKDRINEINT